MNNNIYNNITIEKSYNIYENRYSNKLKELKENVEYFSQEIDNIKGTIPSFINFNTISETISFEFINTYKNTIESLFDNLILDNIIPYSQLVSKKFDNFSCFKILKNKRLYNKFYSNFYSDDDIVLFEEKRDSQGLQSIFKNDDSGMIEIQLKIYPDEKEEENMFEKASLYLSENDDNIICEITINYGKFKKIKFDDEKKSEKEEEIKNIIKNSFIQKDNEKSLEMVVGKKVQEIRQEFVIPKFTMNFTLLSDVIMNNDIFKNVFAIDESTRTSLKNENRINILFVTEFLQKHKIIREIENDINNLENDKTTNKRLTEQKINYLKSIKDSYIKKKFKFSIIREMRENFSSLAQVPIQQIPVGEYFTKIEIVKSNDEMDIQYFIKVLEELCKIYKDNEKILGKEYKKLLNGIDNTFQYIYKPEKIKKVQAIAENPFAVAGSSRGCSQQPKTINENEVVKINYNDDKERCIYGIRKNKDYPGPSVDYSKELMKENLDFVMKIKAPENWQGENILYYACPLPGKKDVKKYPGLFELKKNPQTHFKYIPCCYKRLTNNTRECKDFFKNDDGSEIKKTKGQQYTLQTNKILNEGQTGIIPKNIQQFLLTYLDIGYDYKVVREGVSKNDNTGFLKCMNKLLNRDEKIEALSEHEFLYELTRQECYDLNKDEVKNIILNGYLDPRYFIHFISTIFDVNIVLFEMGKENNELIGDIIEPRHIYGHYEFDINRERTVCIIEHMGSESDGVKYPQCEILGFYKDDINNMEYNFPSKVYDKYVEKCKTYLSKQRITKINLPQKILPNIEKQGFDGFGKSRILFCKHNDGVIQVFTTPLPSFTINDGEFLNKLENSDTALNFFESIEIDRKDLVKTVDSIIGKYNQTYFVIKVDNTQDVDLPESKSFYKKFTNALNIDDNSLLELYRKIKDYQDIFLIMLNIDFLNL